MPFSSAAYLTSQGWSGPGEALQPGGRKKPLTAIKRKNFQGVGKDRDESFAWWDDVFKAVANKIDSKTCTVTHQTTVTGILSPFQPVTSTTPKSAIDVNILQSAHQLAAQRMLYSRFLRGQTIQGSPPLTEHVDQRPESVEDLSESKVENRDEVERKRRARMERKVQRQERRERKARRRFERGVQK